MTIVIAIFSVAVTFALSFALFYLGYLYGKRDAWAEYAAELSELARESVDREMEIAKLQAEFTRVSSQIIRLKGFSEN